MLAALFAGWCLLRRRVGGELHALGVDGMHPEETHQSLRKMEWEGLVRCDREKDGDGISELRYEVTEAGRAYLVFWANSLTQFREEMDLFLDTYAAMPARGVRG